MNGGKKKSSLNTSRPDSWVWMRPPGTVSEAVRREESSAGKPTELYGGSRSPLGPGSGKGLESSPLPVKAEKQEGAEGKGRSLPG